MEVNANTIKELRHKRVLTLFELSDRAGVSKATAWKAEKGCKLHPSTIRKLAGALGVEPTELVT